MANKDTWLSAYRQNIPQLTDVNDDKLWQAIQSDHGLNENGDYLHAIGTASNQVGSTVTGALSNLFSGAKSTPAISGETYPSYSGPTQLSGPNIFPENKVGAAGDYIHSM